MLLLHKSLKFYKQLLLLDNFGEKTIFDGLLRIWQASKFWCSQNFVIREITFYHMIHQQAEAADEIKCGCLSIKTKIIECSCKPLI